MTAASAPARPTNWNLLGQTWAVDMLRQHIVRDAVRHAYLFVGPPGIGRRTLALRFAQALNCTEPIEPGVPCGGICRDCRQIDAMQHPDLVVLQAETEGGTLKVEQIRSVYHDLSFKPYQARYRVAIFRNFEDTSPGAANALLKTLEEPPAYAVLILTAASPESLLPTIVSRCEVLRLPPLPLERVEAFLSEHGAAEHQARLIAHVSGGRPGYALTLFKDPSELAYRDERLSELQSLLPASRASKFSYAEKLGKDKGAMRRVLALWLSYWRDVLLRASGASTPIANIDRQAEIEALAGRVGLAGARRAVSNLDAALSRLEANVNPRLLAEIVMLDMPK